MELKPCPFCGGEVNMHLCKSSDGTKAINCRDCGAVGPWESYGQGNGALDQWNTRAPDRAAYERCAEIAGGFRDDRFDGSAFEDRGDSYRNQQIAAAIRAELATLEGEGKDGRP